MTTRTLPLKPESSRDHRRSLKLPLVDERRERVQDWLTQRLGEWAAGVRVSAGAAANPALTVWEREWAAAGAAFDSYSSALRFPLSLGNMDSTLTHGGIGRCPSLERVSNPASASIASISFA